MPIPDVPLRIVRKRYKLLYFVAYAAEGLLLRIVVPPSSPAPLLLIAGHLLFIVFVFIAVRSFRGRDEPVTAPRAPWRMTGTVRSGVVLAVVMVWSSALLLTLVLGWPRPSRLTLVGRFDDAISALEYLALAVLYVNSAVRLHRSPDPPKPTLVTLAAPLKDLD